MTEPRIEEDIDVQFAHGDPLFIGGILSGRDTMTITSNWMVIEQFESPTLKTVMRIDLSKVNCWRVTRRTLEADPEA